MKTIMILGAAAALLAGAASAQPAAAIHVSTAGKTPVQVKAEVYQAARKLCQETVPGYAYRYYEAKACIEGAARDALNPTQTASLGIAGR